MTSRSVLVNTTNVSHPETANIVQSLQNGVEFDANLKKVAARLGLRINAIFESRNGPNVITMGEFLEQVGTECQHVNQTDNDSQESVFIPSGNDESHMTFEEFARKTESDPGNLDKYINELQERLNQPN